MVRIVLDSSSDYLPEEFEEKQMEMVPFSVTFGSKTYQDGIDITRDEYFDMLIREDEFPTTSQPSPALFLEHFEAAKEAGDEVVCMTLAGALSGSYQSAMVAKDMAEYDDIYVIDPQNATAGIQMLANYACDLRDQGKSAAEITKEVEDLRSRVHLYFMVDTLDYLFQGGRLSRASFAAGKMMRIKPLLMLGDEGEIVVTDRCVGTNRALDTLVEHIKEKPLDDNFPFYSIYSAGIPNCEELEARLRSKGITVDERRQFGLTIGTHSGPGCAGVVFVTKE
ncbi:MAG: DegV family protein [Lachnospiraceae bacterium]|nr:DegV family protein [Lachnospiraceae bacterium]